MHRRSMRALAAGAVAAALLAAPVATAAAANAAPATAQVHAAAAKKPAKPSIPALRKKVDAAYAIVAADVRANNVRSVKVLAAAGAQRNVLAPRMTALKTILGKDLAWAAKLRKAAHATSSRTKLTALAATAAGVVNSERLITFKAYRALPFDLLIAQAPAISSYSHNLAALVVKYDAEIAEVDLESYVDFAGRLRTDAIKTRDAIISARSYAAVNHALANDRAFDELEILAAASDAYVDNLASLDVTVGEDGNEDLVAPPAG